MNVTHTLASSLAAGLFSVALAGVAFSAGLSPAASTQPDAKTTYINYCALCHGDAGEGAKGPPLLRMKIDDKTAARITADGDGKAMPGFSSDLSSDQIATLIQYIRTFDNKK